MMHGIAPRSVVPSFGFAKVLIFLDVEASSDAGKPAEHSLTKFTDGEQGREAGMINILFLYISKGYAT